MVRHRQRKARIYAFLSLLFVFVVGPGLTVLLSTTLLEQLKGHVMWPVLGGLVVGFAFGFMQVAFRNELQLATQKHDRWLDRRPLA